ncbi:MAG: hypothetical protein DRQ42_00605 [Gammaproteobacteria bacterium]|nr:MAG: hypothetical protein DRQ42_00605 [Gammaproteobacteria bacterium]
MIDALQLNNFRTHKDTLLQFDKGVNIVQGQSDSGKSNIIRALRWALLNSPAKGDFSHWKGGDDVLATVGFTEGTFVERTRSKKDNGYNLPTTELRAIRSDLPTEVSAITRLSEINIQGQYDQFYLLQDSPGKVAKELNEAAGLGSIDNSIGQVNAIIKHTTKSKDSAQLSLKEVSFDLNKYDGLDKMESKILEVEKLYQDRKSLHANKELLTEIATQVLEAKERLSDIDEFLEVEYLMADVMNVINTEYKTVQEGIKTLEPICGSVSIVKEDLDSTIYWLEVEEPLKDIKTMTEKYRGALVSHNEFERAYTDICSCKEAWLRASQTQETAVKALSDAFNSLDICPLCKQPLKGAII